MSTEVVSPTGKKVAYGTDKRGRTICVSKLTALGLYRISKILGEGTRNDNVMNMALVAASVESIDGVAEAQFTSERQLEQLLARLDFDGIEAASQALATLNDDPEQTIETAKN